MSGQRECSPASAAMHNTVALMLVDNKGAIAGRLTGANGMVPDHLLPLRQITMQYSSELQKSREPRIAESTDEQNEKAGDARRTMLSVLGKRRRSRAMQVLAVALCPADCKILPQQQQHQHHHHRRQQHQSSLGALSSTVVGATRPEAQDVCERFGKSRSDTSTCAADHHASQCPGSPCTQSLQEQEENEQDLMESSCISTPKRAAGCCRLQMEKLTCPPPPSKASAKPKKPTPASYRNKFFVPSNLTELPPALQSLFA